MDIKNGFAGRRCQTALTFVSRSNEVCILVEKVKRFDSHTSWRDEIYSDFPEPGSTTSALTFYVQSFQFGSRVSRDLIELLIPKSHFHRRYSIWASQIAVVKPIRPRLQPTSSRSNAGNCFLSRHVIRRTVAHSCDIYVCSRKLAVRRHERPMKTEMCKQKRFTFVPLFELFPEDVFLLTENAIFRTFSSHTQHFLSRRSLSLSPWGRREIIWHLTAVKKAHDERKTMKAFSRFVNFVVSDYLAVGRMCTMESRGTIVGTLSVELCIVNVAGR